MATYTADDFARADFARHPDGGLAMRVRPLDVRPWETEHCYASDATMALTDWVPVPHGHYNRHESPDYADGGVTAAAIEKEAEQIEQAQSLAALKSLGDDGTALRQAVKLAMVAATDEDVDTFCQRVSAGTTEEGTASYWHDLWQKTADQRDARDLAAHMWKKAARRLVTQRNGARRYGDFILAARDRATEQVIREQHRAEKAEHAAKERAATIKEQEALIELLRAEQPRALTPDAITDDMRERFLAAYMATDGAMSTAIRAGLEAMLTEPEPRPEGAEEISLELDRWDEEWGEANHRLDPEERDALADYLAERGVRVATEEEGRHATDE